QALHPAKIAGSGSYRGRHSRSSCQEAAAPVSDRRRLQAAHLSAAERSAQQTRNPSQSVRRSTPPRLPLVRSFGPHTRQVVALEPRLRNLLKAIVGVIDGRREIAVDGIDENHLGRTHPPELLLVLVVVREFQEAPAVSVELPFNRPIRPALHP